MRALKAFLEKCDIHAHQRNHLEKPAPSFHGMPVAVMQWLLAQGTDIQAPDACGRAPLHCHCAVNDVEKVAFLLSEKADINAECHNGDAPLHAAAHHP